MDRHVMHMKAKGIDADRIGQAAYEIKTHRDDTELARICRKYEGAARLKDQKKA